MSIPVKICGLSEPKTLQAATEAGARFVGFVFYPPSPRNISIERAAELARMIPTSVRSVALFVDPDDALLEEVLSGVPLDMIQLHGSETPERIMEIKARFAMPVMKAIGISSAADLEKARAFEDSADWLVFDAKPPAGAIPGGTGQSFDWSILQDQNFSKPWMLSGGLRADNLAGALAILKPDALDVSSGVESSRGVKDENKIRAFIQAVKES